MSTTVGPWVARGRGIFAGEVHVATTTHPYDVDEQPDGKFPDYDTSIANAVLIALAPEMLDALRGLVRMVDRQTPEFDAARAIILKAERG